MKIGIIQTGHVRGALCAEFGEYPPMFARLIGPHAPEAAFDAVPVIDGASLPDPRSRDAWVITGSRHGVYEDHDWIDRLRAWLAQARKAGVALIGVCFGHQIMAEAFGGKVEKFSGGWRMGAAAYRLRATPGWAQALPRRPQLYRLHQDQVVSPPPGAHLWMEAEGAAISGLIYGDPARPEAISVQPHPEFGKAFADRLIAHLDAEGRVPSAAAQAALSQIAAARDDNAAMGAAFAAYLHKTV